MFLLRIVVTENDEQCERIFNKIFFAVKNIIFWLESIYPLPWPRKPSEKLFSTKVHLKIFALRKFTYILKIFYYFEEFVLGIGFSFEIYFNLKILILRLNLFSGWFCLLFKHFFNEIFLGNYLPRKTFFKFF